MKEKSSQEVHGYFQCNFSVLGYIDSNKSKGDAPMGTYKCEFLRVEKKYLLDEMQLREIMNAVSSHMEEEHYGSSTILNIYYDTPDMRLIRTSIEKPLYKEKLRLRTYGEVTDDSEVFVEIKKKYMGVVYKRRESMAYYPACQFLNGGDHAKEGSQVLREADWMLHSYQLIPAAAISYDRVAFVGKEDPEFRLTIDRNLKGRRTDLDLRIGAKGNRILAEGKYLMEIKTAGGMPLWMCHLLDELCIFPISFSKYGEYYKGYMLGVNDSNQICDSNQVCDINSIRKEMIKSA
jgi:SPX domain protein involved in polyphosphate accumulation